MKKRKFILGIVSIMTLCLTACGKPNMTFEETIDSITNSEISKMMNNAEIYEQNFEISSNFSTKKDNVDAKISFSTNSKQNLKDSEGETKITLKVNAS
jgi:D-ribose pyranose/furanose isomerase RbsD